MVQSKKHLYLLLLFISSLIIFLWSIPRPSRVVLRSENNTIKLYYDQQLVFNKSLHLEPSRLKIELNHEQDFLLIPPLLNIQKVSIRSLDSQVTENSEIKSEVKRPAIVKNLLLGPYYSGLMSDDSYDLESHFTSSNSYSDFELEAVILNPTVVRIHLSESHFWLRPLWHQEAIFTLSNDNNLLGNPLNLNALTLGKQILAKISLNLLSSIIIFYLLYGILSLLKLFAPKQPGITTTFKSFSKGDFSPWFILILATAFFLITLTVTYKIHNLIPTSQDELTYLFQAKILSLGKLYVDSAPPEIRQFFDQEFIVNNGRWFGKYTIGGSLGLALGYLLHAEHLINPAVSALSLALLFLLCKSVFSTRIAVIASLLFIISPFNLLISASYFSHPTALFFTLLLCYALFKKNPYLCGLALGMIFLTRPLSSLISGCFVLIFLITERKTTRQIVGFKFVLQTALASVPFLLFQLYHNYLLSGSITQFPINIYSSFDKLGFGVRGVEWGNIFTPLHALENVTINFYSLSDMLFGWPFFLTLAFIPFAFLYQSQAKNRISFLFLSFFLLNAFGYFFYHSAGAFFGPRYWYEVSFCLIILTAIGVDNLAKNLATVFPKLYIFLGIGIILTILILISVTRTILYLPIFEGYGETKPVYVPKLTERSIVLIPAKYSWYQYGPYLLHQSPLLTDQIIFARNGGISNLTGDKHAKNNQLLKKYFPDRTLYLLNADGQLEKL